jgi:hypothetical protein
LECEAQALVRQLGDLIVAQKVQRIVDEDEAFRASALEISHRVRKSMVNKGRVLVHTKKNRARYKTDWREPKLLIIYVVNDNGRVDKKILPIIDGTLKGTDVQKHLLREGATNKVIENLQAAAKGSKSKLLQRELMYFINNRSRLCYKEVAALKIPIGSGAIESAVRRVINLRLKSPCIFWKEGTAEEVLLLRAYYKSGRWNLLKKMAYEGGLPYAA